jgi:7,8-dihydropterin-6-yl-methyl-4-(beta-D-ribofuranosyl)aminobenzene 5'-phosphate synthase
MNQKVQVLLVIVFLTFACTLNAGENEIISLYDYFGEEAGDAILDWGFAALVRSNGKLILFDGGSSADILEHNARIFGFDLTKVDIAILSHSHYDHISGFDYLLKVNPNVRLFLPNDRTIGGRPASNPEEAEWNRKHQRGYRFPGADIEFVEQHTQIAPGIALIATTSSLTGLFWKYPPHDKEPRFFDLPELSLAIQTKDSQVEEIVEETRKYVKKNVTGVVGGFHLLPYSSEYISDLAKMMNEDLEVNWVAPGHCTGESASKIFKALYKENYHYFGVGSRIKY